MAMAAPMQAAPLPTQSALCAKGEGVPIQSELVPPKRPAHYLLAVLIACIYEVFPLL